MKAQIKDLTIGLDGRQILALSTKEDMRPMFDNLKDKVLSVEIKEYRERRSLDANAYAWVLLGKLAEVTGIGRTEIYRNIITEIGGNYNTVCVQKKAADELCKRWEHGRLGWVAERFESKTPGCVNVNLYYGSSVYDTKQMSRLIDLIVQECKGQDIETATPQELERYKEAWANR